MKRLLPRFLFQSPRNTRLSKSATSTLVLSRRLVFLSWCLFSWFLPWLFGGWSFCDWKTGCSSDMSRLKPPNSASGFECLIAYIMPRILSDHCHRDLWRFLFLSIIKCESLQGIHCEEKGVAMDWPASAPTPKLTRFVRHIRWRCMAGGPRPKATLHALTADLLCSLLSVSRRLGHSEKIWWTIFPVFYSHFCGKKSVV